MKKVFSLFMVFIMVLSLTACGGGSAASEPETGPQDGRTPDGGETPAEQTATPTPEATQEPTQEPTPEPWDDVEGLLGEYDEDTRTYANELLGFTCKMDEGWTVLSQEEIAQQMGNAAEIVTDEDVTNALESSGTVQPFHAQAGDGLANIVVTVENLGLLYGSVLDEQSFADLSYDSIPSALESVGFTDVETEMDTADFLDGEHPYIRIHCLLPMDGADPMDFYESLVCVKRDNYMMLFTASSYVTDVTRDLLDFFSAL